MPDLDAEERAPREAADAAQNLAIPSRFAPARKSDVVRIVPGEDEKPSAEFAAMLELIAVRDLPGPGELISARIPTSFRARYQNLVAAAAHQHGLDPLLVHAIIRQESSYDARARSRAGAIGLMQIMPATGARFGAREDRLEEPELNIDTGARLLASLQRRYHGRLDLMLAAYNAGEGAVARYGENIPPFAETQNYVRKVRQHYSSLLRENGR
ncbi:MAG: lytic transglycosylase domain-containing protein [Erythrobacter sp.]|nr:lytic transglycosylase domain-containing protein [Erythrobacter sp.]